MYYSNKLSFYFKQYGTQIIVGIVCLIIVSAGLFLYFKINNKSQQTSTVVSGSIETNKETNDEVNVTEDDTILPDNLKALKGGE